MSYRINTYNGSKTFTVNDGSISNLLDIQLLGRNYAGYGEAQNTNFLHLLENFAGQRSPARPIVGQIWYDTVSKRIKVYTGNLQWRSSTGADPSPTAPLNPASGDLWWDSINKRLHVYDSLLSTFVAVGSSVGSGLGTTQMKTVTVSDSFGGSKTIMQAIVNGEIVYIVSTESFRLNAIHLNSDNTENYIPGFVEIKSGITLSNTGSNGITQARNIWGTSSASLGLVKGNELFTVDDFLRIGDSFINQVEFSDNGISIGDSSDFLITIDSDGTTPLLQSMGNTIKFKTGISGSIPLVIDGNDIIPGVHDASDIGSNDLRFKNIYASQYFGSGDSITNLNATNLLLGVVPRGRLLGTYDVNITGSAASTVTSINSTNTERVLVGSNYRAASTDAASDTIAARDINGNLTANVFQGVATSVQNADLAEKYLPDDEYDVGTVVSIGGVFEITACNYGDRALGAVSLSPAYIMNSDLVGGQYVALKGRVPVKVTGRVRKGDRLVAYENGTCIVTTTISDTNVFAIALGTSDIETVKLVEAVIL